MKTLTPLLRQQITEDWLKLFPQMGAYQSMWLARRIGPLVQGICLDRDSGGSAYFPTTHLHNLSRPFPIVSLSLSQRLLTKGGTQRRIDVRFHEQHYREGAQQLAQASLVPLAGDLTLREVIEAQNNYQQLNCPGSRYPVMQFEDGVLLLAWSGHFDRALGLLNQHLEAMRDWPEYVMARSGGLVAWEQKMLAAIATPDTLRETADSEAHKLKVHELPVARLNA